MEKTLVIMAAWLWSRYWWLKQIDWFGPNWEALLEYSIFDAIKAWCTHVILVIKSENLTLFKEKFEEKISPYCKLSYVFQEKTSFIPDWMDVSHRTKQRGSAHAILVCKELIQWSCIIINADDWYWRKGYELLYNILPSIKGNDFVMVWYPIQNTVHQEWTVNRWVCSAYNDWVVKKIEEHYAIWYNGDWELVDKEWINIPIDSLVSMNFWGFNKSIFILLEEEFKKFINEYGSDPQKEFWISTICNKLIKNWDATCYLETTTEQWEWVTNIEDKPILQQFIKEKIEEGYYPKNLWK